MVDGLTGHHGVNVPIIAGMGIEVEQGTQTTRINWTGEHFFRFCANPKPSQGGEQCSGSDFELHPCFDPARCHCKL